MRRRRRASTAADQPRCPAGDYGRSPRQPPRHCRGWDLDRATPRRTGRPHREARLAGRAGAPRAGRWSASMSPSSRWARAPAARPRWRPSRGCSARSIPSITSVARALRPRLAARAGSRRGNGPALARIPGAV